MSYVSLYSSLIASALFVLFLVLLFYALMAAGYWLVFTKAGQPYWHALIPFYNIYTQYRISWDVTWFWAYLDGLVLFFLLQGHGWILNGISFLGFLASTGVSLAGAFKLAKSFGRDTAFAIGLFLLGPVFLLLLG